MSDILEVIRKRRSVRKFTEEEISSDQLQTVLEAGRWAPSWANTQCWEVVLVRSQEKKEALKETLVKGNPAANALTQAPVVLAICGRVKTAGYYKGEVTTKFGDWLLFDLGLFTQNICLAAEEQGLGTVIVGLFDHDRAKEILAVPQEVELVAILPLGRPAHEPKVPERRSIEEFTHEEQY